MKSSSKLKSSLLGLMLAVSPLTIQPAFSATGANPLFQNPLIWLGTPNPTPPPSALIYTFAPLATLPMFYQPYFGWYQNLNFEACVLGLSSVAGPYGTSTTSMTGCNGVANNPERNCHTACIGIINRVIACASTDGVIAGSTAEHIV